MIPRRLPCPDDTSRQPSEASFGPVELTALSFYSVGKTTPSAVMPPTGALSLKLSAPPTFAVGCLAVGIGYAGGAVIAALAGAPWFSHLRQAAHGPLHGIGREADSVLRDVLGRATGPHVVSVALPDQPGRAEVDAACAVARLARQRKAFAIMTVSQPGRAATAELGRAFDCLVEGDGGLYHHWYPSRTVIEPKGGRPICYDLYDVCTLWAGRLGRFGMTVPGADALHVEVSGDVESLAEVDRLRAGVVARVETPGCLSLVNVVDGALPGATAVSFSNYPVVGQERVKADFAIEGGAR